MDGIIFSIEEFSVYDGPGIRSTVFLKGCPLSCSWCHNPEGQSGKIQIIKSPNGCTGCNKCIENSDTKNGKLYFTEKSIINCPMHLLRYCGEKISSEELCKRLLKNEAILRNGGGVTFSGGEPFFQSEFLLRCLYSLKGRLHTAIQTSGFAAPEIFSEALKVSDYFLFDLKLADNSEHIKYTGVTNTSIHQNFAKLAKSGKDFTVRVPLIPGVTDTIHNIESIAKLMTANDVKYAELLPYNKMAGGKYKMLQRKYSPDFDETKESHSREDIFKAYGIKIKIL